MISEFKATKFYFEELFSTKWTDTPIHFAGQEFSGKGIAEWVNPTYTPRSVASAGISEDVSTNYGVLYVACWADTDVDAMELADNVVTFLNDNVGREYSVKSIEVDDHGWENSNKIYIIVAFSIKMLSGICPAPIPNREINLVNNTGESVSVYFTISASAYILINGTEHYGDDENIIIVSAISDVDIKIEYFDDLLTGIGFARDSNFFYSEDISYQYSEVFVSTGLNQVWAYGTPSDSPIDMSHLVNMTTMIFGSTSVSSIPEEWKTLPSTLDAFHLRGAPNLDYVEMIDYYPNLTKSSQSIINSTEPIPEFTDTYYHYGKNAVDAGDFLNTTFSNVTFSMYFNNCNFNAATVDRFLGILVSDGKSSGTILLDNDDKFIGNLNEAPTVTGEGYIDTLRTNGVTITVEGGY